MRIALINPIARRTQGYHTIGSWIPQLGLQVLAELTPREHKVDIIDETFGHQFTDECLRQGRYGLVGVAAYTSGATRSYEIARQWHEQKIPCIMGRPDGSAMPQEASQHFDAVAIGECDDIYPSIIADAG